MATRERLAQTNGKQEIWNTINGHKRTPGSNEQYGIHKYSINGHKRTPGSNEQYGINEIFNKWPQENAWLKRAIWNTDAWLKRAIWNTEIWNMEY